MTGFYENHDGATFPYGLLLVRRKYYVRRAVRSVMDSSLPSLLGLNQEYARALLIRHLSNAWLETDCYANHL